MEKNGAISCNTPCCGCNCKDKDNTTKIALEQIHAKVFPSSAEEADAMENDLTKEAVEAVRNQSGR